MKPSRKRTSSECRWDGGSQPEVTRDRERLPGSVSTPKVLKLAHRVWSYDAVGNFMGTIHLSETPL
jgi:hypothetical protein